MAQLRRSEDLSAILELTLKKKNPGTVAPACNSSAGETETGGSLGLDSQPACQSA